MQSVMLNPGKYWVGSPDLVFNSFKPNATFAYKCGEYSFITFKYGEKYIAAIPFDALEYGDKMPELTYSNVMTFTNEAHFFSDGVNGCINGVELGVLGGTGKSSSEELTEEVLSNLPHITGGSNPIDFPKKTKAAKPLTV
jgi:hypothetical protein